jgi:23S rRNA (adenine2503-C2)-methyltransferase
MPESPRTRPPSPRRAPDARADLAGLRASEIAALPALAGEPPYRAGQVFEWLHQRRARAVGAMTNVPAAVRDRLAEMGRIPTLETVREMRGADGSTKWVSSLADGLLIESVLMKEKVKRTLCISTQVGCAVGCTFCATGAIGLARHLTAGEIVRQVYDAEERLETDEPGARLTNVVLMGMGEPLHNYEATQRALEILVAPEGRGLSPRRITVSTSGYPERIERLAREGPPVRLAVSLSAATDELRTRLIPLNRRDPIASLLEAGAHYEERTGSRVTYEYVLLAGVNDSRDDARRLARLLRRRRVNLIPFNPHAHAAFRPPAEEAIDLFHRTLKEGGVLSTVRRSKGREIEAACGQLAASAGAGPNAGADGISGRSAGR